MAGRDLFGMPKSPPAPPASAAMQSVRMAHTADGTPVFAPVTSAAPPSYQPQVAVHGPSMSTAAVTGGNGAMASPGISEPVAKKKRGRPRKYGPDGSMSLALVPASSATGSSAMGQGSSGPFSLVGPNPANSVPGVSPYGMKKRGRPKGSTNKPRMDALGSSGVGFTPHVITVQPGEVLHLNLSIVYSCSILRICSRTFFLDSLHMLTLSQSFLSCHYFSIYNVPNVQPFCKRKKQEVSFVIYNKLNCQIVHLDM